MIRQSVSLFSEDRKESPDIPVGTLIGKGKMVLTCFIVHVGPPVGVEDDLAEWSGT